MNWDTFKHHGEAPSVAFEAFAKQLFERWCRQHQDVRDVFSFNGQGGDGGVEAIAILKNGNKCGLQAKWFHGTLNSGRILKIKRSLAQAHRRHPTLTHYIVCLPNDLKDSKSTSAGQKSEFDRWQELLKETSKHHPRIKVEYWGKHNLATWLAAVGEGSLISFWFEDATLTQATLRARLESRVEASFATKYISDLHQTQEIDHRIDQHLQTTIARREPRVAVESLQNRFRHMADEVDRLKRLPEEQLSTESAKGVISATRQYLRQLDAVTARMQESLSEGALRTVDDMRAYDLPDFPHAVHELISLLTECDRTSLGYAASHRCLIALQRLDYALPTLARLVRSYQHTARPLLVTGAPGLGKTHGLVASALRHDATGAPVVLIAGGDVNAAKTIDEILADAVGKPGWSLEQTLTALEASANLADRKQAVQAGGGTHREPIRGYP